MENSSVKKSARMYKKIKNIQGKVYIFFSIFDSVFR